MMNRTATAGVDANKQGPIGIRQYHRGRSTQSKALAAGCRLVVKNAVRAWSLLPDLHWPFEAIDRLATIAPLPPATAVRPVTLADCPAELLCATDIQPRRAILYLHGGALLTCGLNTHRALAAQLSRSAQAEVLNIGYRMLPTHRPQHAIEDALDGIRWLNERGYPNGSIVIAGDSAGGFLALHTALKLLRSGCTSAAGVATISPLTDLDPQPKVLHRNAGRCSMFTARAVLQFSRYVAAPGGHPTEPGLGSPVDADLTGMPPVSIHVSSDEFLTADAELMFQRLIAAGSQCEIHLWDGQIHDFPLAADILPEGRRAIRYLGDFIRRVTPKPGHDANTPQQHTAA